MVNLIVIRAIVCGICGYGKHPKNKNAPPINPTHLSGTVDVLFCVFLRFQEVCVRHTKKKTAILVGGNKKNTRRGDRTLDLGFIRPTL